MLFPVSKIALTGVKCEKKIKKKTLSTKEIDLITRLECQLPSNSLQSN